MKSAQKVNQIQWHGRYPMTMVQREGVLARNRRQYTRAPPSLSISIPPFTLLFESLFA